MQLAIICITMANTETENATLAVVRLNIVTTVTTNTAQTH